MDNEGDRDAGVQHIQEEIARCERLMDGVLDAKTSQTLRSYQQDLERELLQAKAVFAERRRPHA